MPLPHSELLKLKRWNTPTIYNGWEQITRHDPCADGFNLEETRDFMPQMGPMVGYAVTVVIEPGNATHRQSNPGAWNEYRSYVSSVAGPRIVVIEDLEPLFAAHFMDDNECNTVIPAARDAAGRTFDDITGAFRVAAGKFGDAAKAEFTKRGEW